MSAPPAACQLDTSILIGRTSHLFRNGWPVHQRAAEDLDRELNPAKRSERYVPDGHLVPVRYTGTRRKEVP
jgi:hypothetical protein